MIQDPRLCMWPNRIDFQPNEVKLQVWLPVRELQLCKEMWRGRHKIHRAKARNHPGEGEPSCQDLTHQTAQHAVQLFV